MKKVMTLAAAGMIALSAPAFAGTYGESAVMEHKIVVTEHPASSTGSTTLKLLGLAAMIGIIAASQN